jgi:hypothetical protein
MSQPRIIPPPEERILDAMIALGRATEFDRMIVAGSNSSDLFSELRRRGYQRVTTTKACRVPRGLHDVALIVWWEHSITALETTLDQLTHFLNAHGALVVWISPRQHMAHNALRFALQRVGFRIESGTCCENGIAISARRLESTPLAKVG